MKLNIGETILRINISFAAAVTLTLIIDESGLCAAALFCCVIHEAGHIICLLILGERPKLIELSFYGVKLERKNDCVHSAEEIAVYASGPLANFILSAVIFAAGRSEGIRMAAVISLCVGVFNMLPCVPLDGGNILRFILDRVTDREKSNKISFYVSVAVLVPMLISGLFLLFKSGNLTLLAASVYLSVVTFMNSKSKV